MLSFLVLFFLVVSDTYGVDTDAIAGEAFTIVAGIEFLLLFLLLLLLLVLLS